MTNFEKWKAWLTAEELFRYDLLCNREIPSIDCLNCPAGKSCLFNICRLKMCELDEKIGHGYGKFFYGKRCDFLSNFCKHFFLAWANAEAEEETK